MKSLHIRSVIVGIAIGIAATLVVTSLFGPKIRGEVSQATQDLGDTVEHVGRDLKKSGKKLK